MENYVSRCVQHTRLIMCTDEDQPIVEEIYVGFDSNSNLVFELIHTDYEDSDRCSAGLIIVPHGYACKLSRQLKTPLENLPDKIHYYLEEWGEIINASFDDARNCFGEIVDCLVYHGCRYRIVRRYPRRGRCCI